jgi:hypothetical protein
LTLGAQHELDTLYSGNDVVMNDLYSTAFKTLFTALFYLPVSTHIQHIRSIYICYY